MIYTQTQVTQELPKPHQYNLASQMQEFCMNWHPVHKKWQISRVHWAKRSSSQQHSNSNSSLRQETFIAIMWNIVESSHHVRPSNLHAIYNRVTVDHILPLKKTAGLNSIFKSEDRRQANM